MPRGGGASVEELAALLGQAETLWTMFTSLHLRAKESSDLERMRVLLTLCPPLLLAGCLFGGNLLGAFLAFAIADGGHGLGELRLECGIETFDLDLGLLALLGASLALCLGVCQKAHKLAHGHVVRQSFELCKQGIVNAKQRWVGVARGGFCRRKITFGV